MVFKMYSDLLIDILILGDNDCQDDPSLTAVRDRNEDLTPSVDLGSKSTQQYASPSNATVLARE